MNTTSTEKGKRLYETYMSIDPPAEGVYLTADALWQAPAHANAAKGWEAVAVKAQELYVDDIMEDAAKREELFRELLAEHVTSKGTVLLEKYLPGHTWQPVVSAVVATLATAAAAFCLNSCTTPAGQAAVRAAVETYLQAHTIRPAK